MVNGRRFLFFGGASEPVSKTIMPSSMLRFPVDTFGAATGGCLICDSDEGAGYGAVLIYGSY